MVIDARATSQVSVASVMCVRMTPGLALVAVSILGIRTIALCQIASATMAPVTTRDGIQMTELADPAYVAGYPACGTETGVAPAASISPNKSKLVVVVRQGDVQRNLNHYTMLLWDTDRLGLERPRNILEMSSSSARPAIDPGTIKWSRDSQSVTFLGEHRGGHHELFKFILRTHKLKTLTAHATSITAYSRDASGNVTAFEALPPMESLWNAETTRHGLVISDQTAVQIMRGTKEYSYIGRRAERQLFVQTRHRVRQIQPMAGSHFLAHGMTALGRHNISLSPNGRYIVVLETLPVRNVPVEWQEYRDFRVRLTLAQDKSRTAEMNSQFARYVLVSVRTGRSRILLNAPVELPRPVIWGPDSRRVIFSQTLMPIRRETTRTEQRGKGERATFEMDINTGHITRIGGRCHLAVSWVNDDLTCNVGAGGLGMKPKKTRKVSSENVLLSRREYCSDSERIQFREHHGRWVATGVPVRARVNVFLKSGMNRPPKLYYTVLGKTGSRLLWDMNPQFKDLDTARERRITWQWSKGKKISGGLYYPVDYRQGQRYPLVIQTHGFDAHRFEFFGAYTTAYAAQPLAARNMFVLQVNDMVGVPERYGKHGQLHEIQDAIKIYRTAVAYLRVRGFVDPKRVGVIAFSHTGVYAEWALTHDPTLFAAASMTEATDSGYVSYATGLNVYVNVRSLYGGNPFGQYLKSWVNLSPDFNLSHVDAPLLLVVLHPNLLLVNWETFEGLRVLGKPVEMIVLDGRANDDHELQRPWDRELSSGVDVDWFDFWLNGHEDSSPGKEQQYRRWEKLCDLQRAENPERKTACVSRTRGTEAVYRDGVGYRGIH